MISLADIPYYVSIRDFLNLLSINSDTWSYVISIGLGYLESHVVSAKLAEDIPQNKPFVNIIEPYSIRRKLNKITYIYKPL